MLYNIVLLISVMQQHESAISIHISPPLEPLPAHSPIPPSRSSQGTRLSSLCYRQLATRYLLYTWWCKYFSATLSIHPTLSFPHSVHKSVLYICDCIPALQIGSSVPFFRFHIYALILFKCKWTEDPLKAQHEISSNKWKDRFQKS